jgi:hypothetical protein
MKSLFFLAALSFASVTSAQQHAPLAAQCQADLGLWTADAQKTAYLAAEIEHMNNATPNKSEINKFTLREITSRADEMGQCADVDTANENQYRDTQNFYLEVIHDRFTSFVRRHHLWQQLIAEDAAGAR